MEGGRAGAWHSAHLQSSSVANADTQLGGVVHGGCWGGGYLTEREGLVSRKIEISRSLGDVQ